MVAPRPNCFYSPTLIVKSLLRRHCSGLTATLVTAVRSSRQYLYREGARQEQILHALQRNLTTSTSIADRKFVKNTLDRVKQYKSTQQTDMSTPADHRPLKQAPKTPPIPIPSSSYVLTSSHCHVLDAHILQGITYFTNEPSATLTSCEDSELVLVRYLQTGISVHRALANIPSSCISWWSTFT